MISLAAVAAAAWVAVMVTVVEIPPSAAVAPKPSIARVEPPPPKVIDPSQSVTPVSAGSP